MYVRESRNQIQVQQIIILQKYAKWEKVRCDTFSRGRFKAFMGAKCETKTEESSHKPTWYSFSL